MKKLFITVIFILISLLFSATTVYAKTIDSVDELYETIANDCLNFTNESSYITDFDISNIDFDSVILKIKETNQTLSGNIHSWSYQIENNQIKMQFTYLMSKWQYKSCLNMAQKIGEQLDKDMTDYQKIKAIHDYLCKTFTYSYFHDGPYDAFIKGKADCEGYALAFQMIMDYCDIPCQYIADGTHAWNIVQIDNKWYNIDVTWDDTDDEKGVKYDYFLKSASDFEGHTYTAVCEQTNYPADLSYEFPIKNLTQRNKYIIILLIGAIIFVLLFAKFIKKKG